MLCLILCRFFEVLVGHLEVVVLGYLFGVPLPRREVAELMARMEGAAQRSLAADSRIRVNAS